MPPTAPSQPAAASDADAKIAALTEAVTTFITASSARIDSLASKIDNVSSTVETIAETVKEEAERRVAADQKFDKRLEKIITESNKAVQDSADATFALATEINNDAGAKEVPATLLRPKHPPTLTNTKRVGHTDWLAQTLAAAADAKLTAPIYTSA